MDARDFLKEIVYDLSDAAYMDNLYQKAERSPPKPRKERKPPTFFGSVSNTEKKHAYVTVVFNNDRYIELAATLAVSIKETKTKYPIICLYYNIKPKSVEYLQCYFDIVLQTEPIHFECGPLRTKRENTLYGKWIDYSFTKWRCFELEEYDTIILLDADCLVLKNIDCLFKSNYMRANFNFFYSDYKKTLSPDAIITPSKMQTMKEKDRTLFRSSVMVIFPDKSIVADLFNLTPHLIKGTNTYDHGWDEVAMFHVLTHRDVTMQQLDDVYCWEAGFWCKLDPSRQPQFLNPVYKIHVIHYYGDKKPNEIRQHPFPWVDVYPWKYIHDCILPSYKK